MPEQKIRVVIHRDHTFEFNGETYKAVRFGPYGSEDDCWDVYRLSDGASVGQVWRLDDIRALVREGIKQDWPSLIEESLDEHLSADFLK